MADFILDIEGYKPIMGILDIERPAPAPDYSMYRQVKHDFEVAGIEGEKQRIRLPETVKTLDDHFVSLNENWQWYWFRLLIHSYTGYRHWDEKRLTSGELDYVKRAWRSLMDIERALTNGHGAGKNADYINRENLDQPDMAYETLTMGGNVIHVLNDPVNKNGVLYYPIETINGLISPPDIAVVNRITRPDLIHVCTNVSADPMRVNPFPQLGGKDVPFPFLSKRSNFIRAVRLKTIESYPPRPYYP